MRLISMLGAIVLGASASVVILLPSEARADSAETSSGKRVAVGELKGAKPQSARGWLIEAFESEPEVNVVSTKNATKLSHGASEAEIAALAAEVEADAIILGTCALKPKTGWGAEIYVHNGEDGTLIEKFTVEGGAWEKYRAALQDSSTFMGAVHKARLAPEPEPEPEPELEEELEEEPAPAPNDVQDEGPTGRPSPLYMRAGVRLYARSFRYTDTLDDLFPNQGYPNLPTYNLPAAPMLFGRVDWYPLAHIQGGFPAHVGLSGGYELGIATDVLFRGETLRQSHSLWHIGPRGRLPLDVHEIGLFGSFGQHSFLIEGDEAVNANRPAFPDVTYRFLDFGLDARLLFDQVRLGAHAKYRMLLGHGDLGSAGWFPNASGRGLSVGAEVGWKLSEVFELLVGVDVLQYGHTFDPTTGAAEDRIAGGATDSYRSVWGALGITLPGDSPTSVSISTSNDDDDDFDDFD